MSIQNQGSINIYVPQRAVHCTGYSHDTTMRIECSIAGETNESFCVSSAYSIAFLVQAKPPIEDNEYFFSRGTNGTYPTIFRSYVTDQISFRVNATDEAVSNSTIGDSNWHHIVATYDRNVGSNHMNLYIDGNLETSLTATKFSQDVQEQPVIVLGASNGGAPFSGNCCNFQFFSGVALTQSQVKMLYNGIPVTDHRVCEFKFDDMVHSGFDPSISWDTTKTIYGTWFEDPTYVNRNIKCWCNIWDEGNWDVRLETLMSASDRNFLFSNVIPGAVRELYNVLGTPKYIDTTYSSSNTLIVEPLGGCGVSSLRSSRTIGVKNISDTFFNRDIFSVKIDGMRL